MILDVTVLLQTDNLAEGFAHRDAIISVLEKIGFNLLFTSDGTRVVVVEASNRTVGEEITQYMQEAS